MSKTVAMTGATGFVGKITLERLVDAGWKVRALTRREQPARDGVTWVRGALDDVASLDQLCDGADAVLHIAGVVNAPDKAGFEAGNVIGTANVIAAAKQAGVRRFIHVSSLAAREPGLSEYGASKARAEKLVGASMLDWTMVRPPAVYGPGDTEMLDLFRLAKRGLMLLPPRGKTSLIHVDDLARLLIALLPMHEDATGRIFEADDGVEGGWTYEGYARAIGWALGRRVAVLHAPRTLLKIAAHADMTLRRSKAKLTPDRANYMAHPDWVVTRGNTPPAALWKPQVQTRQGLKDTVRWYRAQGWL